MKKDDTPKENGTSCRIPDDKGVVKIISEGQLCPNCIFAKLVREPGNIVRCPVCGWGNASGCT